MSGQTPQNKYYSNREPNSANLRNNISQQVRGIILI